MASRQVVLQVLTSGNFSIFQAFEQQVKETLQADNWDILDVQYGNFDFLNPRSPTVTIYANVDNNYDDNYVINRAKQVLSPLTTVYAIGIVKPLGTQYITQGNADLNQRGTQTIDFTGGLGTGLGVSIPLVIAGAVILGIVLIKRK